MDLRGTDLLWFIVFLSAEWNQNVNVNNKRGFWLKPACKIRLRILRVFFSIIADILCLKKDGKFWSR